MPNLKAYIAVALAIWSLSSQASATLHCVSAAGPVRSEFQIYPHTSTVKVAEGSQFVSAGEFQAYLDDSMGGVFQLINFVGHAASWQIFLSPAGNYLLSGHAPASDISDELLYERYAESLECSETY